MALTTMQECAVIEFFITAFIKCESKVERNKLVLRFEDEFGKSIVEWKTKAREALIDHGSNIYILKEYIELTEGNYKKSIKNSCKIRPLEEKDLDQIRELINKALNIHLLDNEKYEKFVGIPYSLVACNGEEILGVILADSVCKVFFDEIWVDVFAVSEGVRGQGIGTKLFEQLKSIAISERKNVINIHTERNREAYQIYKHWGFKEIEGAQMECFCI